MSDDKSWKPKKKRDFKMPSPEELEQLQENIQQIDEQRQHHQEEQMVVSSPMLKDKPRTWIFLPFDHGYNEDHMGMGQQYLQERLYDNPRDKSFSIIEHMDDKSYMSRIQPGDTILVFSHGAPGDSERIYSDEHEDGGDQELTAKELAQRMLDSGLDPNGVNLKLCNCYGGGEEHKPYHLAKDVDTFARTFSEEFGDECLKRGLELPTHVDGYVGQVGQGWGPRKPDGSGRGRVARVDDKMLGKVQKTLEDHDMDHVHDQLDQEYLDHRAQDNRMRYNLTPKTGGGVDVSLDQKDHLRSEDRRLDMEVEMLIEKMSSVDKSIDKKGPTTPDRTI